MTCLLLWLAGAVAIIYLAARIRRAVEGPPDWDDHPRNWW
jgi:hypothetical protein